jgi:hypothetical protein
VLGKLEPESVDAIVTDPPYGIGFQHERWDSAAIREAAARAGHDRLNPNEAFEAWCRIWAAECRRVMKPGAFLAAFGSPRTYHRLACGVEDAGLEIRDTLMWAGDDPEARVRADRPRSPRAGGDDRADARPIRDRRSQCRGLPGRGPPPGERDLRPRPRLRGGELCAGLSCRRRRRLRG